ncbi:helix-turn-helix transcriptional regulator [Pedobacter nanyangensis]|uniref:helix-turn-helix transcriptional regulator n=1 Tax=Pedobacter nanyangensis TaxID=1562389 RepID=UPI000DE1C92C|nr:AraC family transcriptional regulator [Pedobacter nanyangensis]
MKHVVELANGNRVTSENTCESFYSPKDAEHFYTMRFVFSGSESCTMGRRKLNIFPDSFAFFNAGTTYKASVKSTSPVTVLSLAMRVPFIENFHRIFNQSNQEHVETSNHTAPFFMETLYPLSDMMQYHLHHLKASLEIGEPNELKVNQYLHDCLFEYYRIYQNEVSNRLNKLNSLNPATRKELLRRLLLAREFINGNFNRKIYLEDISAYCCLSVNHLLRTFKAAYGITPFQYLIQLRLQRAKSMLLSTNYSVKLVAGKVGLKDTSAFIRLFNGREGKTPLAYRKYAIGNNLVDTGLI